MSSSARGDLRRGTRTSQSARVGGGTAPSSARGFSGPKRHDTAPTTLRNVSAGRAGTKHSNPASSTLTSGALSRAGSAVEMRKDADRTTSPGDDEKEGDCRSLGPGGLFHVIQQLAALEGALYSILDGLKSNATHVSFFCREYWGTSASHAQLSLERLGFYERLKKQVQQACVLESLSLGVASHLCSGTMQNVSITIRSRLRNLLYYIHENCLVLLDLVCRRWQAENPNRFSADNERIGHCPENLNLDFLVRVKRYRRLQRGEHIMALRQHNEMISNVVRQLCRGAASARRQPLSGRSGLRSPSTNGRGSGPCILTVVNDILSARVPLDKMRASTVRSKLLQSMRFLPLLRTDSQDEDCPWPSEDPYDRYGSDAFPIDGQAVWFEPLPPMLPNLEHVPKLPVPDDPDAYTLVLDLDETLVHYSEDNGMGSYEIRPGMTEFLRRMYDIRYEIVIFTAATQDYADWVIDRIDPERLICHRLYRQHALPWGPIFVKDLSRLGRDLDKIIIVDNVQENFMLQPNNGIFILTWYDDLEDNALTALTPLLEELVTQRVKVHELLDKYRDQIPIWAGFDNAQHFAGDASDDCSESGALTCPPVACGGSGELANSSQPVWSHGCSNSSCGTHGVCNASTGSQAATPSTPQISPQQSFSENPPWPWKQVVQPISPPNESATQCRHVQAHCVPQPRVALHQQVPQSQNQRQFSSLSGHPQQIQLQSPPCVQIAATPQPPCQPPLQQPYRAATVSTPGVPPCGRSHQLVGTPQPPGQPPLQLAYRAAASTPSVPLRETQNQAPAPGSQPSVVASPLQARIAPRFAGGPCQAPPPGSQPYHAKHPSGLIPWPPQQLQVSAERSVGDPVWTSVRRPIGASPAGPVQIARRQ